MDDLPRTTDDPATPRTAANTFTRTDVIRSTEPVVAPIDPDPLATERVERETVSRAPTPGFSFGGSFLGWNVAAFWMLVFNGIVLAILGTSAYTVGTAQGGAFTSANIVNLTTGGIVGVLISTFLAYLIGGYAAARMARGSGVGNGVAVAVWGVVIAILVGVAVYAAGASYNLGYWASFYGVNFGAWTGQVVGVLVGTLIAMFLGAILGGLAGGRRYDTEVVEERRGLYRRGRPL